MNKLSFYSLLTNVSSLLMLLFCNNLRMADVIGLLWLISLIIVAEFIYINCIYVPRRTRLIHGKRYKINCRLYIAVNFISFVAAMYLLIAILGNTFISDEFNIVAGIGYLGITGFVLYSNLNDDDKNNLSSIIMGG